MLDDSPSFRIQTQAECYRESALSSGASTAVGASTDKQLQARGSLSTRRPVTDDAEPGFGHVRPDRVI